MFAMRLKRCKSVMLMLNLEKIKIKSISLVCTRDDVVC